MKHFIQAAIIATQILLVILKLTETITISWWIVLLPTIIPAGLTLIIIVSLIIALSVIQAKEITDSKGDK